MAPRLDLETLRSVSRAVVQRLLSIPNHINTRRAHAEHQAELAKEGFDQRHGTDTVEVISGAALGARRNKSHGEVFAYQSTRADLITTLLDALPIDFTRFSFVDVGCGKGKPLLVASDYPFKQLIGIDISERCIGVARRNVEIYKRPSLDQSRISLQTADIEDYTFPDEPLVIYLFNPFPAPVMSNMMTALERSLERLPRDIAILYVNPTCRAVLEASPSFSPVPTVARYSTVFATRPLEWVWPRCPEPVAAARSS